MATMAAALIGAVATPATAQPALPSPVAIDIRAQPLADALTQLGRQTSLQLFFTPALVAGKQAPAVHGSMSAEAALDTDFNGMLSAMDANSDGFVTQVEYRAHAKADMP